MSHKFIPGIASQSLGNPRHHGIRPKLEAAAAAYLESVEIFFEDIAQLAQQYHTDPDVLAPRFQPQPAKTTHPFFTAEDELLLSCASQIRQWCLDTQPHSLDIICLQPFMHCEGLLDIQAQQDRWTKLELWIQIAKHLGTTLIQVPSNFLSTEQCTGDRARIVSDLRRVAQKGAEQLPPIRFAYEALCWGTHINTWDAAWEIVQAVDMDNFGTCLDTFNLAGRVYADPERTNGKAVNADTDIAISIQRLRDTFSDPDNLKKVFYVELCDGEALDSRLDSNHAWYNAEQQARMTWSRNARLFPFETDRGEAADQGRREGYLPVEAILDTLLDVGYEGYLAFEVFNRSLNQPEEQVIQHHQFRAGESWQRCKRHIDRFLENKAHAQLETITKEFSATLKSDNEARLLAEQTGISTSVKQRGGGSDFVGIAPRL